jgi:predicted transglutaminase-like cysteine proteinase
VSIKSVFTVLAAVAASLSLAACATDSIPVATALTDGALTAAPAGWVNYCTRHSEDSGCRA